MDSSDQDGQKRIIKVAVLVGFILVSCFVILGAILLSEDGGKKDSVQVEKLLDGIEQEGLFLGDSSAPVVVAEFADLRCPYCAELNSGAIRDLIEGPVREGRIRLEFRYWSVIVGSAEVARALYAAAEQNRAWYFIENFYAVQQSLSDTTIPFSELEDLAQKSGLDIERWKRDFALPVWDQKILQTQREAASLDFAGTPSVALVFREETFPTDLAYDASASDFLREIKEIQVDFIQKKSSSKKIQQPPREHLKKKSLTKPKISS